MRITGTRMSTKKPGIQTNDRLLVVITGLFLVAGIFMVFSGMKTKLKLRNYQ